MNKKIKIISLLLIMVLCMTAFVFTVTAATIDNDTITGADVNGDNPSSGEPSADTSSDTPSYSEDPSSDTPSSEDPSSDTPSYSEEPTVPPSSEVTPSGGDTGGTVYPEFSNGDNDGADNDDQITNEVTDKVVMYEPDKNNNLEPEKKWSNITLDTSKAPKEGEVQSFKTIKTNTSTEDNGDYILYIGLALIVLAIIGILYYTIATVTYRKKLKALKSRETSVSSDSHDELSGINTYSSKVNKKRKRHYGTTPYSSRKGVSSDTAEIPVKKNYKARH